MAAVSVGIKSLSRRDEFGVHTDRVISPQKPYRKIPAADGATELAQG